MDCGKGDRLMREVWLALGKYATGIYKDFPAWAVNNLELIKWKKVETEVEAKKQVRNSYSSEALFLMGLEDLTEMEINTLYTLPRNVIGCFVESIQEDKGGEDNYDE